MILALITAWLAYKKANESGRNGIVWAIVGVGVFIGTQVIVQLGLGVLLGLGMLAFDWPESLIDTYTWPITIVSIVASFGTSWLLLRYLDRPLNLEDPYSPPPPPPTFRDHV